MAEEAKPNVDAQRNELLRALFEIRPIAFDIIPCGGQMQAHIRVLNVPIIGDPSSAPLHKLHSAIFHNQTTLLQDLLAHHPSIDVNAQDPHGNTPLHLACALGRVEAVELLLRYGALPTIMNKDGWHAIAEATSFGDRYIIERVWFAHRRVMEIMMRIRKKTILNELATKSSDFFLQMEWKFESWLPFTERFCPKDSLKIYKKGSSLRADFTLVGFENFTWQRGNCSLLLSVSPKTSKSTSFLLDHDRKVYQKLDDLLADEAAEKHERVKKYIKEQRRLRETHVGGANVYVAAAAEEDAKLDEMENDIAFDVDDVELSDWSAVEAHPMLHHLISSEVDTLMSTPISDTSSPGQLEFSQATTGYFMFKKPRIEQVGDYSANVWEVSNMNLSIKKRTEHLTMEDKLRHEQLSSIFGMARGAAGAASASSEQLESEDPNQHEDGYLDDEDTVLMKKKQNDELNDLLVKMALPQQHRKSLPRPPEPEISFENYLSTGFNLGRDIEQSQVDKSYNAKIYMSDTFPLKIDDLMRIVKVLAPHHRHLEHLKRFVTDRLPPGFPVRIQMPVFPTVKADVQFVEYIEEPQPISLFLVPADYSPGYMGMEPMNPSASGN